MDRNISSCIVLSTVLWAAGFTLVIAQLVTGLLGLGNLGLLLAGAGGILNVRRFFALQAARERNAFELGQDSVSGLSRIV